jgi:hypothetical protein
MLCEGGRNENVQPRVVENSNEERMKRAGYGRQDRAMYLRNPGSRLDAPSVTPAGLDIELSASYPALQRL